MKFLKSPMVMTILVILAGVFFAGDIIKMVEKISPSAARTLARTKSASTTEQTTMTERIKANE